jgi:hypothetical protein
MDGDNRTDAADPPLSENPFELSAQGIEGEE